MPLYTYQCESCEEVFETLRSMHDEGEQLCKCGSPAHRTIGRANNVHTFKEGWWENLDHMPVYIESKRQLKEVCKRTGNWAVGVLD